MADARRDLWALLAPVFGLENRHVISFDLHVSLSEAPTITVVEMVGLDARNKLRQVTTRCKLVDIDPGIDDEGNQIVKKNSPDEEQLRAR